MNTAAKACSVPWPPHKDTRASILRYPSERTVVLCLLRLPRQHGVHGVHHFALIHRLLRHLEVPREVGLEYLHLHSQGQQQRVRSEAWKKQTSKLPKRYVVEGSIILARADALKYINAELSTDSANGHEHILWRLFVYDLLDVLGHNRLNDHGQGEVEDQNGDVDEDDESDVLTLQEKWKNK
eukprot:scaffold1006_cov270-Pinguiococcus_pyrenoidosus.AAC.6